MNYSNPIVLKFHYIENITDFIRATFIPICNILKNSLSDSMFHISSTDYKTIIITFFIRNQDVDAIIHKLQLFMYKNISELNLNKIEVPCKKSVLTNNCQEDCMMTKLLCQCSEHIVGMTLNKNATENARVAFAIAILIQLGRSFYVSISGFQKNISRILSLQIPKSISNYTKTLLNHNIILNVENKLMSEYEKIYAKNLNTIYANYYDMIHSKNKENYEYDFYDTYWLQCNKQHRNKIFRQYADLLLNTCLIPSFYRAFIPFCISKLFNENEI